MLATSRDFKQVADIEKLIGTKLEHRTLEGLAEAVQARPAGSDRPRNGRDRNGGRGGRNDRDRKQHNRPVADHGQRASMEPAQIVATPVAEAPKHVEPQQPVQHQPQHPRPRQDHRQNQNKPQKQQQPKPQAQNKEPKISDAHQLPAFLLRPVKLPPAEKPKAPAKPKQEA